MREDYIKYMDETGKTHPAQPGEMLSDADRAEQSPTYIRDVSPIGEQTHIIFKPEDMKGIVEAPLLAACQTLHRKGVWTTLSGANNRDLEHGFGWIYVAFDELVSENQEVGQELVKEHSAQIKPTPDGIMMDIKIPFRNGADTTVAEFSAEAEQVANRFVEEPPYGFGAYKIEDMREINGYNRDDASIGLKELEEIGGSPLLHDPQTGAIYIDRVTFEERTGQHIKVS